MTSLAWTRGLLPKRMCCVLLVLAFSQPLAAQSVALISDLNGRYGSQNYAERIEEAIGLIIQSQPDLVISSGDMVAGQKQPELDADQLDRMWQAFNRVVTDPLARAGIPFVVTAGNHDASAFPPFELEQQRFQAQWNTRKPELEMLAGSEWPTRYMRHVWVAFCCLPLTAPVRANWTDGSWNLYSRCCKPTVYQQR